MRGEKNFNCCTIFVLGAPVFVLCALIAMALPTSGGAIALGCAVAGVMICCVAIPIICNGDGDCCAGVAMMPCFVGLMSCIALATIGNQVCDYDKSKQSRFAFEWFVHSNSIQNQLLMYDSPRSTCILSTAMV